jgi:hypothetical protein
VIDIRQPGGRVLTARLVPPVTLDEINGLAKDVRAFLLKLPEGTRAIICSEFRSSTAFAQEIVDVLIRLMTADNERVEKSGMLYSRGGSMGLQLSRAIRESKSGERRTCLDDAQKLIEWFAPSLDAAELHHVTSFYVRAG